MYGHDLQTSLHESEERAAKRGRTTTRNSALRSWRAVEAARRDPDVLIVSAKSEGFADDAPGPDRDHWWEDAGKVRVQRTTGVPKGSAMVSVVMGFSRTAVIMAVLMMALRSGLHRQCACAR